MDRYHGWRAAGALLTLLCGACTSHGDGTDATREHRDELAKRTHAMRAATGQVARGSELAGDALRAHLIGRTWVQRYSSFPDGKKGDYVLYRYFRSDGVLVRVDNWLSPSAQPGDRDRWEVDGPKLCLLEHSLSDTPGCFRVSVASSGTIQLFIDEPGAEYDRLLTSVVSEFLDGPPPGAGSAPEPRQHPTDLRDAESAAQP